MSRATDIRTSLYNTTKGAKNVKKSTVKKKAAAATLIENVGYHPAAIGFLSRILPYR